MLQSIASAFSWRYCYIFLFKLHTRSFARAQSSMITKLVKKMDWQRIFVFLSTKTVQRRIFHNSYRDPEIDIRGTSISPVETTFGMWYNWCRKLDGEPTSMLWSSNLISNIMITS